LTGRPQEGEGVGALVGERDGLGRREGFFHEDNTVVVVVVVVVVSGGGGCKGQKGGG